MLSLSRNGYTADDVKKALHAANRQLAFKYELLDNTNKHKAWLTNVMPGSKVAYNVFNEIKRTATFQIRDDGSINFLSDRIKPWVLLRMSGGWAEFPKGVFLLSTPKRSAGATSSVFRNIEAYDQLQVLKDDKVEDRYTIVAGTNYITRVKTLLDNAGITLQNLTATDKTLPADRDWEPGTSKLQIINDLLGAINYRSLWFDDDGFAIAQPYVSPTVRASEYTYKTDKESVILPGAEHELDLFKIPNKWVLYVSEADRSPLRSVYTNTNANSPTSTVSRGRIIMADPKQVDAADQTTLDTLVQREAFEASQVYEAVEFETGIMPFHSDSDVFTLEHTKLGISAKFSEVSWEFEFRATAPMKHRIRRVITI
ncbi:hypothetical protein [Effusibacillus consociatus]|uniref:Uncharacterized protein n=1 Tax=Effusibacillus consociatus TaxID=1117041 RepID=A0ABV9Q7Y4_9BACL